MAARAHIGLETKLASALLALGHVPYEHAKQMSAKQIVSLYAFDHGILHAIKPVNDFWNLTPRLIAPHRRKSAADTGVVAKVRELSKDQEDFQRKVLARPCGQKRERKNTIRSRGFSKQSRPMRSARNSREAGR